jgi:hypothetical protein
VPLTVSPFISLPTATTLPYTYKTLPNSLPPSSTGDDPAAEKPKFVVSSTGLAAHPEDIIASCKALQDHLKKQQDDAQDLLQRWQVDIAERELAEKRRLAPGWLDRQEKILEPERRGSVPAKSESIMDATQQEEAGVVAGAVLSPQESAGAELDRAFRR